jgi:lipid A 4'-phosphatase
VTLKLYALLLAAAVATFLLFPQIDLAVSGWFWNPATAWELGYSHLFGVIHAGVPYGLGAVMVGAAIVFALNLKRGTDVLQLRARGLVFVVLALLLGPGLLANVVLKDNWGRARPSHLIEFGGKSTFSPALIVSDQCKHNCAFVAGDAAAGFFLLAFALLARRHRTLAIGGALGAGAALGAVRIVQGGHFLSDVVFAGLFVGGLVWLLHALIMTPRGPALAAWLAAQWRTRGGRLRLVALAIGSLAALAMVTIDRPVALWVNGLDPSVHRFFSLTARPGLSTGWLIGAALLGLGCAVTARLSVAPERKQRWRSYALAPLFVFAGVAVAGLTTDLVKAVLGRFRPKLFLRDGSYGFDFLHYQADYLSFPSGHATTAFALATAFTLLWPRPAAVYFLLAAAIGASRVLSNAHWVSDALVGAFVGTVATLYVRAVFHANGVTLADMLAGRAVWRSPAGWSARLALGRGPAQAGGAPCLPVRRPLP